MFNKYALNTIALCSLFLFACKKKKDDQPIIIDPQAITAECPDIAYLDSATIFTTNAPADWDVLWQFGDSATSTEKMPSHVYKKMGKYYLQCAVSKNNSSPLILRDSIIVTNPHFAKMEGVRNWHYSVHYDVLNYRGLDSTYVYPDQTFALSVQLPDTIVLPDNIYKGASLKYQDVKDGQLYFWAFRSDVFPNQFELFYNITTNVITLTYTGYAKDPNGMGGATSTSMKVTAVSY